MIRRVEVKGYKCLRYNSVRLNDFHVLVGPNASGKSTFFDALQIVRDLLSTSIIKAIQGDSLSGIQQRASQPTDLSWGHAGDEIQIAIVAEIPAQLRTKLHSDFRLCRYEIALDVRDELRISKENLLLCPEAKDGPQLRLEFPAPPPPPASIVFAPGSHLPRGYRKVVGKVASSGNDYFAAETGKWNNLFRLGPTKSALANLPEDEEKFPVATWFKRLLMEGVQRIVLSAEGIRLPSPPGSSGSYAMDGSNLPWIVNRLEKSDPRRLKGWVSHLRTALPDLESVSSVERQEDKHRYIVLRYRGGLTVPSWNISDGTLRMMALTLLAYTPTKPDLILIEEPENGIHPRAAQAVFDSLSSVYGTQVFCASHSPVFVTLTKPENLLCFAKDSEGATDIVNGADHPRLLQWKEGASLGTLFASGVLG